MPRVAIVGGLLMLFAAPVALRGEPAPRPASAQADGERGDRGTYEPPVIPVGLDAFRQWERWPYQRIGARAYMRSTYDRSGGNEGADASHFLYQTADEFNVALDLEG